MELSSIFILSIFSLIFGGIIGYVISYLIEHQNKLSLHATKDELITLQQLNQTQQKKLDQTLELFQKSQIDLASTTAEYQTFKSQTNEKINWINTSKEELVNQFKQIANQVVTASQVDFKRQSKDSIETSLSPLKQEIEKFNQQTKQTQLGEVAERSALKQMLTNYKDVFEKSCTSLNQEAVNLTRALQGNKQQGNWGEMILERVLESVGLTSPHQFEVQKSYKDEQGSLLRPDIVVHLPDGKDIIIDSKVSLTAYSGACSTQEANEQKILLTNHVNSLKKHINDLSSKNYTSLYDINSLEMILLFVPIEGAYVAAIKNDSNLFEYAFNKKVVLVHPVNLWSTLKIVQLLWRNDNQTRHAQKIAEQAGKMYDKFCSFIEELTKTGQHLNKAQLSFDATYKHLSTGRGNLVVKAEQLKALGIKNKKDLDKKIVDNATVEDVVDEQNIAPIAQLDRASPS